MPFSFKELIKEIFKLRIYLYCNCGNLALPASWRCAYYYAVCF